MRVHCIAMSIMLERERGSEFMMSQYFSVCTHTHTHTHTHTQYTHTHTHTCTQKMYIKPFCRVFSAVSMVTKRRKCLMSTCPTMVFVSTKQ